MHGLALRYNFSLALKLVLGFLVVTVPSVAVLGGISFYALHDLNNVNRQLYEISRSLESVRALEAAFGRMAAPLSDVGLVGGEAEERRFAGLIHQVDNQLHSCADAACHGNTQSPTEMANRLVPYVQQIRDLAALLVQPGPERRRGDRALWLREISRLGQDASGQMERMSSKLVDRIEALQGESRRVDQRMKHFMAASIALILLVAIAAAYLVAARLLKPIRELLAGTGHVMSGDLGYRVPIVEKDEIGELAQSFNSMAQELQDHRRYLERMVQAKAAELQRAQESLLQSEKLASIGLLASGVAHELNNPLTSILMNVNLLMEEIDDGSDLHRELRRISDDTVRCKRIIDDLRDFSRRHELEIRSCDLDEVIGKAVELIRPQLKHAAISLVRPDGDRLPSIACDPARIEQVLMNVFINAIQAMPSGGTLTVGTGIREGLAEIVVEDTGFGIPADIKGKIFDPFFTTKADGTGLGLSIVYRIMEEHGGKVEIDNNAQKEIIPGEGGRPGTAVRLLLPLVPARAVTSEADKETAELRSSGVAHSWKP